MEWIYNEMDSKLHNHRVFRLHEIMIKNFTHIVTILFLTGIALVVLVTCHRKPVYPAALLQVDSLTLVEPEEALALLATLERDMQTAPEASQRYYQLLCLKAADKAYITHTSDSLILDLVSYYENGGDELLLADAYYYAGRVYRDLGDAPQALAYFQRSLEAEDDEVNPALYAQIGEVFFEQSLYPQALEMYQEAYRRDSIAVDTIGAILDLRDIAFTYRVQHQPERALTYLHQAERLAAQSGDEASISLINAQLAALYNRMGRSEEALPLIEEALPQAKRQDRFALLDIYGNILLRQGDLEKAEACFEETIAANDLQVQLDAYNGLTQIAAQKHRKEDYLSYFNQYRLLTDSLRRMTATESVSRMNALYNYQIQERDNAALKLQNQQKQTFIIILLCVFVLLFVCLFAYFRYRRLQMKQRLEHVQRLLKEYLEKEVRKERQTQIEQAVQDSEVMHRLLDHVEKGRPLTDADIVDIEALLNEVIPDFLPLLGELGDMSSLEYQVSLLLKVNLTPIQISSLILRDKSTISAIRRRLYKKITGQEGSPADWDAVVHSLGG